MKTRECKSTPSISGRFLIKIIHRFFIPGTNHAVLTLENSVFLGGSFYSISTMPETLVALIHTLANDRFITNSSHPELRLLIRKIVQYLHETVVHGAKMDEDDINYVDPNNLNMTTAKSLFACISFGILSNILDARTYSFDNSQTEINDLPPQEKCLMEVYDYNSMPESERVGSIYTRGTSYEMAQWFAHQYELKLPGDGASVTVAETLNRVMKGVAHEAVGVYAARMRTKSPLDAAPNASLDLISRQLHSFGKSDKENCQGILQRSILENLESCKKQALDDKYDLLYVWDKFSLHRRSTPSPWDIWPRRKVFDAGKTMLDAMYVVGLGTFWGNRDEGTNSSGQLQMNTIDRLEN